MTDKPIAVLGAGSWGTALAMLLARAGHEVVLWAHNQKHADAMVEAGYNERYLPGASFPEGLLVSGDLASVLERTELVLIVVPSHAFQAVLFSVLEHKTPKYLAWATKGLEPVGHQLLHKVAEKLLPKETKMAVISGPTFAKEVAKGLPTAVTVASSSSSFAAELADLLGDDEGFRAYTSDDVIGVEVGGAAKNVLAIAAGIADGLGFGANTRAALISRGLAEMTRLGVELGGKRDTFMGLAGLGDLVLTATDNQSRNRRFGLALAQNKGAQQAKEEIGQVVEGEKTAKEIYHLAKQYQVDMPITEQVYRVLYEGCAPLDAVHALLHREQKSEL